MRNFILHVGPMKTSSTYIQNILSQNRDDLARQGWKYPGKRLNQQSDFYGLCGPDIPWVDSYTQSKNESAGKALATQINNSDGHIIVSAEALANLSHDGIERLLRKIPVPDTVVFTHRPLTKVIPSAWQQSLKGGGTATLDAFTNRMLNEIDQSAGNLYMGYALGDAVARWKSVAGSRVVLVKIPTNKGDSKKTWPLFQNATGIPPLHNLEVKEANLSLSFEAARLLRDFNICMKENEMFSRQLVSNFFNNCLMKNRFGNTKIILQEHYREEATLTEAHQMEKILEFSDDFFKIS